MAAYFTERDASRSEADFPLPSDELIYDDEKIPPKLTAPFLSNEILKRGILKDWTGDVLELYDNSAPLFDSFRFEEEAEAGTNAERPEIGYNLRYEKVEKTPMVLKYEMCFGHGDAFFRNGNKYTGDMAFSMMHGRGVLESENLIYSGTFRSGEIEGNGKYEWENAVYEGDLKRGLRNGEGTLTFKNGVEYTGNWREGLRDGFGKITFPDGQSYEGYWKGGLKHGQGVQKFASGNYYEGNFEDDLRSGQGTMYWPSSHEKYQGQWKDGLPNGYGVQIWLDPIGSGVKQLRNRYVGQWLNGLRHGYGIFYYANGSKYEGNWVANLKEGEGIYTYEDGSVYEGPFANDHMVNRTVTGFVDVKSEEKPIAIASVMDTSKRPGPKPARTQPAPAPSSKKSRISGSRAKKLIEMNPYKGLIDVSDLTEIESDELRAEKEVENLLLKWNSDLKAWYIQYSTQVEAEEREESFTMTSKQLWRFLRDCQILSFKLPLAQVNRLFIQGKKSNFSINNYDPPKLDLRSSRTPTPIQPTPQLDISKINPTLVEFEDEEDEDMALSNDLRDMELEDVHRPDRTLLQRQFVEALVRVAFLKYSNGGVLELGNEIIKSGEQSVEMELPKSQLGIALFRLFREKLLLFAGKNSYLTDKKQQELQDGWAAIKGEFISQLFSQLSKVDRGHFSGKSDKTVEVKTVRNLLRQRNVIPGKLSEVKFYEVVELGHDPEIAYTKRADFAGKEEEKSKALFQLLGLELIKPEFIDLMVNLSVIVVNAEDRKWKAKPMKEKIKRFLDILNPSQVSELPVRVSDNPVPEVSAEEKEELPEEPAPPQIIIPPKILHDRGRQMVLTGKLAIAVKKEQALKAEQDRLDFDRKEMPANDVNVLLLPAEAV